MSVWIENGIKDSGLNGRDLKLTSTGFNLQQLKKMKGMQATCISILRMDCLPRLKTAGPGLNGPLCHFCQLVTSSYLLSINEPFKWMLTYLG